MDGPQKARLMKEKAKQISQREVQSDSFTQAFKADPALHTVMDLYVYGK